MEARHGIRKVYLAKGETLDIHIDASLPQHQIEGVRFLYRTFIKKKPGVVLNDPSGYGKRVQTVIFLNAIRPLLDKPVLILCKEGKEDKWVHRFNRWSGLSLELSVVQCNPPVLKSFIYINPMSNLNTFCRREWSIVVVDDCTMSKEVLKASLNTHYKIWLSDVDMRTNLQVFSPIYKWLYPKDNFNVGDFQVIKRKPSIVYKKSVLLDAFMEDIVLRRGSEEDPPFRKNINYIRIPPIVSRKNKDPTGKKIKRSKRDSGPSEPTPDPMDNIPTIMAKDILENFINDLQTYRQENFEINDAEVNKAVKRRKLLNAMKYQRAAVDEDNSNAEGSVNISIDAAPSQDIRIRYDSESENDPNEAMDYDEEILIGEANLHQIGRIDNIDRDHGTPDLDDMQRDDSCDNKDSEDVFSDASKNSRIDDATRQLIKKKIKEKREGKAENEGSAHSDDGITIHSHILDAIGHNTEPEDNPTGVLPPPVIVRVTHDRELGVIIENTTVVGDIEAKMKQLEAIALSKYKGSLLDTIF